jgi:small GTP-binding protein
MIHKLRSKSDTLPGVRHVTTFAREKTPYSPIGRIAWSPDGHVLAIPKADNVDLWNWKDDRIYSGFTEHGVYAAAWATNGRNLITANLHGYLASTKLVTLSAIWKRPIPNLGFPELCVSSTSVFLQFHSGHIDAFSGKDGRPLRSLPLNEDRMVASKADTNEKIFFRTSAGAFYSSSSLKHEIGRYTYGTPSHCSCLAISPDSKSAAYGIGAEIIFVNFDSSEELVLQGHSSDIESVVFTGHPEILASRAADGQVIFWNPILREKLGALRTTRSERWPGTLAFNPKFRLLAVVDPRNAVIEIYEIDPTVLLKRKGRRAAKTTGGKPKSPPNWPSAFLYQNAKVLLVGNSSVGKSGLGLVLASRKWKPTDSTHGRHIWKLDAQNVLVSNATQAIHETILWDLAGQPGYRIIHGLHLSQVSVAIICFDASSEIDPFAGVGYWAKALDEATNGFPVVKLLVAARCDRGSPQVSPERIEEMCSRYKFAGYFPTSARRGDGISALRKAIEKSIFWEKLPHISTEDLFRRVRSFLLRLKRSGLVIRTETELRAAFNRTMLVDEDAFAVVIDQLENAGFLRRLDFGGHVLLQPELLDAYLAWMAYAAREEPDGLGELDEDLAKRGGFSMDHDRPLHSHHDQELILLAATVQEAVRRNLVWRQPTERGVKLVFPSELNPELPDYPGGYSLAVAFDFEGPVSGIYSTLAVRLLNSQAFTREKLFRNAALFFGPDRETCGFTIEYANKFNDSSGRLTVFFAQQTGKNTRLLFLRYVNAQLEELALKRSVIRHRIYHCGQCDEIIQESVVAKRRSRGKTHVSCSVCERIIPLDDLAEETAADDPEIPKLEGESEKERSRQTRLSVLSEKERGHEFHVFLCHNSKDKPAVIFLSRLLREQGVLSWLDTEQLRGGDRWSGTLEAILDKVPAIVVCIGAHGNGPWQQMEYEVALNRFIETRRGSDKAAIRLIPVLLPGAPDTSKWPAFLRGFQAVDMRNGLEGGNNLTTLANAILGMERG